MTDEYVAQNALEVTISSDGDGIHEIQPTSDGLAKCVR